MNVLVTGGNGFLGKHVCAALERTGITVSAPSHRDYPLPEAADHMIRTYCPDAIVHLAADVGGIGLNVQHPGRLVRKNLEMGVELMEMARIHDVQKMVTVGTACQYPADAPMPLREEDLWNGKPAAETLPYAEAKRALMVMGQAYREEYGFNAVFLIPTNLYGPMDHFDVETGHVIPSLIRKFEDARVAGEPRVDIWGAGQATRDFLYAPDAAEAIVRALVSYDSPDPLNLGSGNEVRINDLVFLIKKAVGYDGGLTWNTQKPTGTPRRCLDTTKSVAALGEYSRISLATGIDHTIGWWRVHR